ncbi:MAG: ABC transporter permease, partial [Microbacterium sp.]|nr:ABC transporter permease [Microbacterium sp.]
LQQFLTVHPLSVLWPGLAITLTVLGLNLLGDAIREATDPTLARRGGSVGRARTHQPEVVA